VMAIARTTRCLSVRFMHFSRSDINPDKQQRLSNQLYNSFIGEMGNYL